MKQATCAQMGNNMPGTCQTMIQVNTAEEMGKNGMAHVQQNPPDIVEQMKDMTDEDRAKWMADFQVKFDAMPDMA